MDKVAENLQGNENVAFVFLDQGVSSFEGFKLFRESLEDAAKIENIAAIRICTKIFFRSSFLFFSVWNG